MAVKTHAIFVKDYYYESLDLYGDVYKWECPNCGASYICGATNCSYGDLLSSGKEITCGCSVCDINDTSGYITVKYKKPLDILVERLNNGCA